MKKIEIKDNGSQSDIKENSISITNSTVLVCNTINGLFFSFGKQGGGDSDDSAVIQPFVIRLTHDVFEFVMKAIDSIQQEDMGSECSDSGYDPDCGLYFKLGLCEQSVLRHNIHDIVEQVLKDKEVVDIEKDYMMLRDLLWTAIIHYFQDKQFFSRVLPDSVRDMLISSLTFNRIKSYYDENFLNPSFKIPEVNSARVFNNHNTDFQEEAARPAMRV